MLACAIFVIIMNRINYTQNYNKTLINDPNIILFNINLVTHLHGTHYSPTLSVVPIHVIMFTCLCSPTQKRCVIEELYQFEFFSELLEDLGVEIALSMP